MVLKKRRQIYITMILGKKNVIIEFTIRIRIKLTTEENGQWLGRYDTRMLVKKNGIALHKTSRILL